MTLSGTSSLDCQVHVRNVKYTMFVTHTVLVADINQLRTCCVVVLCRFPS
jgi:hypothetical protein